MSSKFDYSKKILKLLAEKPAVSLETLKDLPTGQAGNQDKKASYAIVRALKNLNENGLVQIHNSENRQFIKITAKGKNKLNSIKISGEDALVPGSWDGLWRIIILDLDESRKNERESLRYLLKKANFVCVKNTVWVSPYPYENLFMNIKKDLGLKTEIMIIVTDKIDTETKQAFFAAMTV